MTKKFALDIFDFLAKLNSTKSGIYDGLSEEERKAFSPLVVMRWLSGTSDTRQIMMLNTFANTSVFQLGAHKKLLAGVLQACTSKVPGRRYKWMSIRGGSKKKDLANNVISQYYGMSSNEIRKLNPRPTSSEIMSMAEDLGFQKDELTQLKKELS